MGTADWELLVLDASTICSALSRFTSLPLPLPTHPSGLGSADLGPGPPALCTEVHAHFYFQMFPVCNVLAEGNLKRQVEAEQEAAVCLPQQWPCSLASPAEPPPGS